MSSQVDVMDLIAQKDEEIALLRKEKVESDEQRGLALMELDRAADVFEKMELELQARENEILELRRQVSLQSSSVESLKQELSAELEKSKQAHSQQVKQLTLRNDQLLAEIEALRRSSESGSSADTRTEALLQETTSALNEWIQECQKLQESVAERDKEIEAMRESLANAGSTSSVEIDRLNAAVQAQQAEVAKLKSQLNASEASVPVQEDGAGLEELRLQLAEAKEAMEVATVERAEVVLEKEESLRKLKQAEGKLEASLNTETTLVNDLNFIITEKDVLSEAKQFYEAKVAALEIDINELKERLRAAEETVKENEFLMAKLSTMEAEINDTKSRLRQAYYQLEVKEAVADALREGYSSAEKERGALLAEIEQRDTEESELGAWSRSLLRTMSKL